MHADGTRIHLRSETMFKGLGDLTAVMQQAREAQSKMKAVQERLANQRVEGTAGGGMVRVEIDGRQNVTAVQIEPTITNDLELLQDLVRSATNDALAKSANLVQAEMADAMGGLDLPGLENLMNRFGGGPNP